MNSVSIVGRFSTLLRSEVPLYIVCTLYKGSNSLYICALIKNTTAIIVGIDNDIHGDSLGRKVMTYTPKFFQQTIAGPKILGVPLPLIRL